MAHVMIDLETLGTTPDCVVLTLGAVKFNPYDLQDPTDPLYLRINVDEQTEKGRIISTSTMKWWVNQSAEAQAEAFSEDDRVSMDDVTTQLNRYLVGADKIWAQGPLFDIMILENFYKMLNKPAPWQYWQIRDSRTIFDLGDDSIKTKNTAAHNALADSYCQAVAVQQIYKQRGVTKK
jgi:hypothetical protein